MQPPADRAPAPPRHALAAIETIVGLGAVYGGFSLLRAAEGFGARHAWLRGSVFPDYTLPGIVLLVVIGGGMLGAAALTFAGDQHARTLACSMGIVLLVWGIVETVTIGYVGGAQVVLLGGFVIAPGLALILLARSGGRSLRSDPRCWGRTLPWQRRV
jgi:hypothetical protein